MLKRTLSLGLALGLAIAPRLLSQERGAAALGELVQGLGTTTRVLMIGAHPDDEDTQLIAYLARAKHIETAYLSLTRGDGGQNLIGNQLGPELGMIRTEELLAARRIDGGRQYFTRAYDFGFSKTLAETEQRWPKDSILKDMVAIVRAFRPQVIVSVWSGTPADGHGHHQYAGVRAREVFDAAMDTVRFPPSSMGGLQPWTVSKFFRSRRRGAGSTKFNVGEYDPLIGRTYSEVASESRSQHRSQGQGELQQRGPRFTAVQLEASRVNVGGDSSLFAGLDTSWHRFESLPLADSVRSAIDSLPTAEAAVRRVLDLIHPSTGIQPLASYLRLATRASSGATCTPLDVLNTEMHACAPAMGDLALALESTTRRATDALLDVAAVSIDATAPRELIAQGDSVPVAITLYNQGTSRVALESVSLLAQPGAGLRQPRVLLPDSTARETIMYRTGSAPPTTAWWLRRPLRGDTFDQPLTEMVTGEDRLQTSGVEARLEIAGVPVAVRTGPIVYRFASAALGEVRRPIAIVPEVSVLLQHEVEYARANAAIDRTMLVNVRSAASGPRDIAVTLALPAGLSADSATRRITLPAFGDASVYFRVRGRLAPGGDSIRATATTNGKRYALGFVPIEYEHIRPQRFYRASTVALEAVNATFANLKIGYIRGVGDNVMPMLEELGLSVTELDPATLAQTKLGGFTTIVIGTRAYGGPEAAALIANTPVLMNFARNGGTIVTQYGQFEMQRPGILPYPITLTSPADRVTDETAPVRVLDPGSPLLSHPNTIREADFANWVQERALYMPHTFDAHYRPLFSMNDKGEPPNDAAVLVAPVGKGTYVYTTLSFFRQLPAGNPGAARLFINLLSADQRAATRPPAPASGAIRP